MYVGGEGGGVVGLKEGVEEVDDVGLICVGVGCCCVAVDWFVMGGVAVDFERGFAVDSFAVDGFSFFDWHDV